MKTANSRDTLSSPSRAAVRWPLLFALTFAAGLAGVQGKTYLSLDLDSIASDGYASQVAFIQTLVTEGHSVFDLELLYWIHGVRALIALMMNAVSSAGGSFLLAALVATMIYPLLRMFSGSERYIIAMIIPFALVALSYRAVLVFVSIGYLILFIRNRASTWYLLISMILATLSSGAVLIALLVATVVGFKYRRRSGLLLLYVGCMATLLVISLEDKIEGFLAGDVGYESTIQGGTGIVALLSRSTIFVSFLEGNYLRAFVYFALFFAAVVGLIRAARSRRYSAYAAIFTVSLPAFFLEGLGVVSLLVPVLMYLAGLPFPYRPLSVPGGRCPIQRRSSNEVVGSC